MTIKFKNIKNLTPPKHGGNALELSTLYKIPQSDWIDLTAALNPQSYPVSDLPQSIWQSLPQAQDGLLQRAAEYYGLNPKAESDLNALLLVPGSSWAIHALPATLIELSDSISPRTSRVWVPKQGFSEHAFAWEKNGYSLRHYESLPDLEELQPSDVFILINPNNPTGELYERHHVLKLLERIERIDGLLVVDEAFMDVTPQHSVMDHSSDALVVLRSFGKFFGLAGIRLGAVKANRHLIAALNAQLPPWSISGPTRFIAKRAFSDIAWQHATRQRLLQPQREIITALNQFIESAEDHLVVTPLFYTLYVKNVETLHQSLAKQGIFTRLLDDKSGIRLGVVPDQYLERMTNVLS